MIGAGIAGLTAACALAQRGYQVTVLERAAALREVGAGLQISPNAVRVIEALGLWPRFEKISVPSRRVELHDSVGRTVAVLDLARHRPADHFRLVHRAKLLAILETAAREAGVQIKTGHQVTDIPDVPLLIGADGVKSRLRSELNGIETPFFTGQTAWRTLIPAEPDAAPVAQVFMGPGRHLVSYPLGAGLRNIVAVVERPDWREEGWSIAGDPAELRAAFARFGGPVPEWLARVDEASIWGLFRHTVAAHWQDGRRALIGDAAHPTLPFMAQGAVMAIEDAWVLAACLAADSDQQSALARFQALRQPRCQRIVEAANANARNYHLRGPTRAVAHAGLRAVSRLAPGSMIRRFAWLYDYDPTTVV
ncbi:FAD-dependent monooxygenase [Paracoccus kondratievae]|uniref:FAD-dependent monooxygenase n=1 Tax=Paracoccus kondratievae TaxID=135740 RepID=UPI0022F28CD6|nr:FAD-dependent monooxygenase [Paracoccus kondratievae]